jgi:hypothetical protein
MGQSGKLRRQNQNQSICSVAKGCAFRWSDLGLHSLTCGLPLSYLHLKEIMDERGVSIYSGQVLSDTTINSSLPFCVRRRWVAMDADVKFTGKRIVCANEIRLQNVVANLHMKDKVLKLTPPNFGMAGGQVSSNILLDGRNKAIDAQARPAARHLKIRELFP